MIGVFLWFLFFALYGFLNLPFWYFLFIVLISYIYITSKRDSYK